MSSYLINICNPGILPTQDDFNAFVAEMENRRVSIRSKDFHGKKQVSAVYGLFEKGKLAYIGSSRNVHSRIIEHRCLKPYYREVAVIELDEESIRLAEYRVIRAIRPARNGTHARNRRDFGGLPIDELAVLLNTTPGEIRAVCAENDIPITRLNASIADVVWHFSRRQK